MTKKISFFKFGFWAARVFLISLTILSCTSESKTGIEGSGNSNNQVIITDKVENATINNGPIRLTKIPDDFSRTLSLGMNPEIIVDKLGPPERKSSIDVFFIENNEKIDCIAWYYSFSDLRLRFDIIEDKIYAYTIEIEAFPREQRRIFLVELFCSDIYLGKSTFGEVEKMGEKSFVNQLSFGNYRDGVLLGRYTYPPVCSRNSRNRGSAAYFASVDYEIEEHEWQHTQWEGNGIYEDFKGSSYRNQVITSVTIAGNAITSNRFGFHLSPPNNPD